MIFCLHLHGWPETTLLPGLLLLFITATIFVLDYSSGCCFSCRCSAHLRSKAASCWLFLNTNNVTSKCFSFNITCGMLVYHQFTPFSPLMVRSELMTVSPSTPPSWSTSLGKRERLNLHLMISTGTGTYYRSSTWLFSYLPIYLISFVWTCTVYTCILTYCLEFSAADVAT